MNAIGIARVSSSEQNLKQQTETIRLHNPNIEIKEYKTSAWKGNFLKRVILPILNINENVTTLVFSCVDRFTRNLSNLFEFISLLKREISIIFVQQQNFNITLMKQTVPNNLFLQEINNYQTESILKSERAIRYQEARREINLANDSISDLLDEISFNQEDLETDEESSDEEGSPAEEYDKEKEYEIDYITTRKKIKDKVYYHVKWKNYDEMTYEPRSELIKNNEAYVLEHEKDNNWGRFKRARYN